METKYYFRRSSARVLALLLTMGACGFHAAQAQTKPVVWSDQQLIAWAHDTYERDDYLYAAIHINALLQRNPKILKDNPDVAQGLNEMLAYAIVKLQASARDAALLPVVQSKLAKCVAPKSSDGLTATAAGLEIQPSPKPQLDWRALGR